MEIDCVLCDIVAGVEPASVILEDDNVIVFMDLRQPTSGHILIVPKQHVETLDMLPLELAGRLMQATVRTARAMRTSLRLDGLGQWPSPGDGLSLWSSNGSVAGQEAPHVHLHLLARHANDGLLRIYPADPRAPDRDTLDQLAAAIRAGFVE